MASPSIKYPLEDQEQSAYFDWLDIQYPNLSRLAFAVPNGTFLAGDKRLRAIQMAKLKKQGLKPGTSDIIILYPNRGYHGCVIEMKRHHKCYPKISDDQHAFLEAVAQQNYANKITYGCDEAIEFTKWYMG